MVVPDRGRERERAVDRVDGVEPPAEAGLEERHVDATASAKQIAASAVVNSNVVGSPASGWRRASSSTSGRSRPPRPRTAPATPAPVDADPLAVNVQVGLAVDAGPPAGRAGSPRGSRRSSPCRSCRRSSGAAADGPARRPGRAARASARASTPRPARRAVPADPALPVAEREQPVERCLGPDLPGQNAPRPGGDSTAGGRGRTRASAASRRSPRRPNRPPAARRS